MLHSQVLCPRPPSEDRKADRQYRTTGFSRSHHTMKRAKKLGCSVPSATVIPTAVRQSVIFSSDSRRGQ